jgi:hypothetical protein
MIRKILPFILGFMIIFTPSFLVLGAGLIPDCNSKELDIATGQFTDACDFNELIYMVNKIINYVLIILATPIFALIMMYTAWLYMSDMGSSENHTKAIKIFKNAFLGYIIALASWLIIKTILVSLGFNPKDAFLSI